MCWQYRRWSGMRLKYNVWLRLCLIASCRVRKHNQTNTRGQHMFELNSHPAPTHYPSFRHPLPPPSASSASSSYSCNHEHMAATITTNACHRDRMATTHPNYITQTRTHNEPTYPCRIACPRIPSAHLHSRVSVFASMLLTCIDNAHTDLRTKQHLAVTHSVPLRVSQRPMRASDSLI